MDKKTFVEKAKRVFGEKYSYERVPEKVKVSEKIPIICPVHGLFYQVTYSHLNGNGCQLCARRAVGDMFSSNTEEFIEKASRLFENEYDYSKAIYINNRTKVEIICSKHGPFFKTPNNHLNGQGCPLCAYEKRKEILRDSLEDFIGKAKKVHGGLYDYKEVSYKSSGDKVKIVCRKHGPFMQTPRNHLTGQGCPICKNSKGEQEIYMWLNKHEFKFEPQKKFKECKGKRRRLPFDFYLPDHNILIEYDGKQHFENNGFFRPKAWDELRNNDEIKNRFAKKNNFKMIRIKYTESVDDILSKNLLTKDLYY